MSFSPFQDCRAICARDPDVSPPAVRSKRCTLRFDQKALMVPYCMMVLFDVLEGDVERIRDAMPGPARYD